jgi:hypothetical protein
MSAASRRRVRGTDAIGVGRVAPGDAHEPTWIVSAMLLVTLPLAIAGNAHAALYKWTDANGHVHYSDQLPADALDRERFELNRQGLTVRKTEPVRRVAQQAPKSEDEQQRGREAERERQLAARRDRAILESYSNEGEIDLAKGRAVATIEGQVQSAQAFIAQMAKRRSELEGKKATYAPRPVPGSIEREIESIDAETDRQNEFIVARMKEAATVAARYESDKQRFRELRGGTPSGSMVTTDDGRFAAGQPAGMEPTGLPIIRR